MSLHLVRSRIDNSSLVLELTEDKKERGDLAELKLLATALESMANAREPGVIRAVICGQNVTIEFDGKSRTTAKVEDKEQFRFPEGFNPNTPETRQRSNTLLAAIQKGYSEKSQQALDRLDSMLPQSAFPVK